MQAEVTTRAYLTAKGASRLRVRWTVLPRGSGNARTCRRFAKLLRSDRFMGPLIKRLVVSTSSVTVYVDPGPQLLATLLEAADAGAMEIPGQMKLFTSEGVIESRAKV